MSVFNYSVAIRTLGTAGHKYQILLDSLKLQTIQPKGIYVFIAEGYPIPKETVGIEQYIYVKKGMLAQRALNYDQIDSEYILFLDDDLCLPNDAVERMSELLYKYNADVISPDIFNNANRKFLDEIMMIISGRMIPRYYTDTQWGYKVMRNGGYSYNKHPVDEVYVSQTNAGACFLCRKDKFLSLNLSEELWVDRMKYPLGEDQITYYKMYKRGLKILTYYQHNIKHLDSGDNMSISKERTRLYGDAYFKIVFWHRFMFLSENRLFKQILNIGAITYTYFVSIIISLLKLRFDILRIKLNAIYDAIAFLQSEDYKTLPRI